jgi:hypothetical protein
VAYRVSGFIGQPPIDRISAEHAYGSPIPDLVWEAIAVAFEQFGEDTNVLSSAPRVNENRNDDRSYPIAQRKAVKSLDRALLALAEMQSDPGMIRAMSIASMDQPGGAASGGELWSTLKAAEFAIHRATHIVHRAGTPPTVGRTEEDARKILARTVLSALNAGGLDTGLTGWGEAYLGETLAEEHLTRAERLIWALKVHVAESPSAFVRWLRGAIE